MANRLDKELTQRLKDFSVWKSKPKKRLKIRCRNRYGSVAHFQDYEGVVLIGFGDEEGLEPDKDALKFDKKDLPAVIDFLQRCREGTGLVYWHCPLCNQSGEVGDTGDPFKDGIRCFKNHSVVSPDCPEVKSFGQIKIGTDPALVPPSEAQEPPLIPE